MAKGWAAARLRLRSEVRTTRAGLALLVAVLALSAGVAMAAVAGARRWTRPRPLPDLDQRPELSLPAVASTSRRPRPPASLPGTDEQADDAFAHASTSTRGPSRVAQRTIRVETIARSSSGSSSPASARRGGPVLRARHGRGRRRLHVLALGLRSDRLRLALLRGLIVGLAGAALALVVAVVMSPLFPVGIGRVADPVGLHADAEVLAAGFVLTLFATVALSLVSSAHRARAGRSDRPSGVPATPFPLPASSPPVLVGMYFALPGRSRASTARASLLSLVVVVVILAATAVRCQLRPPRRPAGPGRGDLARRHHPVPGSGRFVRPPPGGRGRPVPGVDAATSGTWATTGAGIASGLVIDGHLVGAQVFGDEGPINPPSSRAAPRSGRVRSPVARRRSPRSAFAWATT